MRIKKLLLLLVLFISSSAIKAQTNFEFPLSGTYNVQQEVTQPGQPIKIYDQVIIDGNNFQILKENHVLKHFKIIESTTDGYKAEQYFPGNEDPKKDRERFTIQIVENSENECFITIVKPLRTEQVHLIKN